MVERGAPKCRSKKFNYILDQQIGFMLRISYQRHTGIFAREIGTDITTGQWAALSKLAEKGACSQNQLGRLTAMDVATIKGVVDRLTARGLTNIRRDPNDQRRLLVELTPSGRQLAAEISAKAVSASRKTLAPLDSEERAQLITLLKRLR